MNKSDPIARRGYLCPVKSTAQFTENAVLDKSGDTYESVSLERFDELVLFLVDYSLKVSEAYIPLVVRSAITNVVS